MVFDNHGNSVDNNVGIRSSSHHGCNCDSGMQAIWLLSENEFKSVAVKKCRYNGIAHTMIENFLWPLSPEKPNNAIDIAFMKKAYQMVHSNKVYAYASWSRLKVWKSTNEYP